MDPSDIEHRLATIKERMAHACNRAGRNPAEVQLLAVSKKKAPVCIAAAAACGLRLFGENRVQEAAAKIPECPDGLTWHLIGHLQSNKVRPAVELFEAIHSVDSAKLLQRIDAAAAEAGRTVAVLLQVNVAGEAAKFGLAPDAIGEVLEVATGCINVDVVGLMTIPPLHPDPEASAPYFARLRTLRDRLRNRSGFPLDQLSMGMSGDFEVAIREGATIIRVGTALLGEREPVKEPE
jgi:pyridoxal phosphate enzyme (YggS family)